MLPQDIASSEHRSSSGRKHFMEEDHTFLPPALSSYSIALLNENSVPNSTNKKPSEVTGIYDLDFPNTTSRSKIRDKLSAHFKETRAVPISPVSHENLHNYNQSNKTSINNEPRNGSITYEAIKQGPSSYEQHPQSGYDSNHSNALSSHSSQIHRDNSRGHSLNISEMSGRITGNNHSKDDVMDTGRRASSHSSTSGSTHTGTGNMDRSEHSGSFADSKDRQDRLMPPVKRIKGPKRFGRLLGQDSRRVLSTSVLIDEHHPNVASQPYSTMLKAPSTNTDLDLSFLNKEKELELRKRIEDQKRINEQENLARQEQVLEQKIRDNISIEKLKLNENTDISSDYVIPSTRKPLIEVPPSNIGFRKPKLPIVHKEENPFQEPIKHQLLQEPRDQQSQPQSHDYNQQQQQNQHLNNHHKQEPQNQPSNPPVYNQQASIPSYDPPKPKPSHPEIELPPAVIQSIKSRKPDKPPTSSEPKKKTIVINGTEYEKLELLGRGGTSKVYKVKSSSNHGLFAIKKVTFDQFDDVCIRGFKGEIDLLLKLQGNPRVVQLIDYAIGEGSVYLVMECGEIDFSYVLQNKLSSHKVLDVNFVKFYAIEMLKCVKTVHESEIVHSDLKPANFLFVKGILKIIDFGIANAVPDHTTNIYRDSQIGTPNYMAPEALIDMNESLSPMKQSSEQRNTWKVGKPSDVWSCGCIIYQMIYGKPPYAKYQGNSRILAIMNPQVKIQYPSKGLGGVKVPISAIELMQNCLSRIPNDRWTIDQCLVSDFLKPKVVSEAFIRDLVHSAVNFGYNNRVNGTGIITTDVYDKLVETVLKQIDELKFS